MSRRRVDSLLAERGLAPSRTAAASSVRAGLVRVGSGGERVAKPSQLVPEGAELSVEGGRRFVSRGGEKLDPALDALGVTVEGRDCLDVGASTGGFSDCLLSRGATRVIALDVGRGQLDWTLRNDPRVAVLEGVNARELEPGALPWVPELATIDLSFISLGLVLGPVASVLAPTGEVVAMVKPQFEVGPAQVGRGGVVRDAGRRAKAVRSVAAAARAAGLAPIGAAPAGVPGPKGNREVFLRLGRGSESPSLEDEIEEAVR